MAAFHLEKKADLTIGFTRLPKEGGNRFGQALMRKGRAGRKGPQVRGKAEKASASTGRRSPFISLSLGPLRGPGRKCKERLSRVRQRHHPCACRSFAGLRVQTSRLLGVHEDPGRVLAHEHGPAGNNPAVDLHPGRYDQHCTPTHPRPPAGDHWSARRVEDSLFYSGCTIKGRVVRSLLFPGVTVEEGAVVKDSILFFDAVCRTGGTGYEDHRRREGADRRWLSLGRDPLGRSDHARHRQHHP